MKVGDLVELSAYGRKLTCNFFARDAVGLVTHVDSTRSTPMHVATAITVRWTGQDQPMYQIRRDLKFAK